MFKKLKKYNWGEIMKILAIVTLSGILIFSGATQSCITAPKIIDTEPLICTKATQWLYLAVQSKKPEILPESVTTSGIYNCSDQLKISFCNLERIKYLDKNPFTKNRYDDLQIRIQGRNIYDQCLNDMKR